MLNGISHTSCGFDPVGPAGQIRTETIAEMEGGVVAWDPNAGPKPRGPTESHRKRCRFDRIVRSARLARASLRPGLAIAGVRQLRPFDLTGLDERIHLRAEKRRAAG